MHYKSQPDATAQRETQKSTNVKQMCVCVCVVAAAAAAAAAAARLMLLCMFVL